MATRLNHPNAPGPVEPVAGRMTRRWTRRGLPRGALVAGLAATGLLATATMATAAPAASTQVGGSQQAITHGLAPASDGVAASAAPQAPGAITVPQTDVVVSATPRRTVGFNDTVSAEVYAGNTIYVGGSFTTALSGSRHPTRNYLAAVDATSGALLSWAPRVNGAVTSLAVSNDALYIGGRFTQVNGQPRRHLAKISRSTGAVDPTFKHSISSPPYQLTSSSSALYVVGNFGSVDGRSWHRAAAFSLGTGQQLRRFRPALDGTVRTVRIDGNRAYLGGDFHTVDGVGGHPRLAAVDAATGQVVPGFQGGAPYVIHDLAVTSSGVYGAMGGPGGQLVSYRSTDGAPKWSLTTDGDVQTVAIRRGVIYAGGHFDHACTTARVSQHHGDCLDGQLHRHKMLAADADGHLLSWSPQANSVHGVFAMVTSDDESSLSVGGEFTTFGGNVWQPRFAVFGPF